MAYNDISKNFTYENGGTIDGDLALTTMAANTIIKNKASGQLYSKRSGFSNVFDKTNTYANYLKADEFGINTSGSGNGVASITYSTSGRKITQNLTTFTTPSDLATVNDNLKSQAVGSITVSGRTVTYKNVNGQNLGSFQTQDNDTTYSANKGITLTGTTFGHSIEHANNSYDLESVGSLRLSGKTLIVTAGKITFDKYGHMTGLSNIERSVDLSELSSGGGSSYQTWYVKDDGGGFHSGKTYSSSEIYSHLMHETNSPHVCTGLGTSDYWHLGGSHPAPGTYRCDEIVDHFSKVNQSSTGSRITVYFAEITITKIA